MIFPGKALGDLEEEIVSGFGFALGGVLLSVLVLWLGGEGLKKKIKRLT